MRAVLQRVGKAGVKVDGRAAAKIGPGLLVLLGVAKDDTASDAVYVAKKIGDLRLFGDSGGFDLSVRETGGEVLVVSQFTLYGDVRKGRRPSFDRAAGAETAKALYELVISELKFQGLKVSQGVFQAKMAVELINDGPVTVIVESRGEGLWGTQKRTEKASEAKILSATSRKMKKRNSP